MTKEERHVVNPLMKWFRGQRPDWQLHRPRYGTAATGWDIEARRKNQDLLIEAKSSLTAPLTRNQSLAFPEIAKGGGTIVGQGKPGFSGGTFIPPTKVNVVRP